MSGSSSAVGFKGVTLVNQGGVTHGELPGIVTLQYAYDNSTSPEITVDATRGALTIRGIAGQHLLQLQDAAGNQVLLASDTTDYKLHIGISGATYGGSAGNNVLYIGRDTNIGRVLVEGIVQADLMLTDRGGSSNTRIAQLINEAGTVSLKQISDIGTEGWIFLGCELATGDIGIGTTAPQTKLDIYTGSNTDGIRLHGLTSGTQIGDIYVGTSGNLILSAENSTGTFPYVETKSRNGLFGFIIRDSSGASTTYGNLFTFRAYLGNQAYMSINVNSANSWNGLTVTSQFKVGMGSLPNTADAKLHVVQQNNSAGVPVLDLEQLDINDTFINFIGTTNTDGSRSISTDTTEDSAKYGAVRIEINGVLKWLRVYDDES